MQVGVGVDGGCGVGVGVEWGVGVGGEWGVGVGVGLCSPVVPGGV